MQNTTTIKSCLLLVLLCILTAAVSAQAKRLVVAKDGSGDFQTVQAAINAVPDSSAVETVIYIKKGFYHEKLTLPASKQNVHFIGEETTKTILSYDDYASKKDSANKEIGTSGSSSFFIYGDGFTAENISFENASGPVGQAVAVRITGDRACFINCRFLGFQDTLYTHGTGSRQYYRNCYIEGTVDFIFGSSVAYFENCTIFGKKAGFFTAASTPADQPFGYVFYRCHITGDAPAESFYLGRPWRPAAKTVFIQCRLDALVKKEGWHNWGKKEAEERAFYAEYRNRGEGSSTAARVPWSNQLKKREAKAYTVKKVLRGWYPDALKSQPKLVF